MENMEVWNAVNHPPPEALKTISGGRLNGMTDIKPQWRYQVMTEQFGMCGVGWKFESVKEWAEQGPDGNVFAFVDISLYVKVNNEWSDPIPGNGGSMLVQKENAGLHANDEAFKMATTDALSTAMQKLGVAADIYAGLWDGSKYRNTPATPQSGSQTGKSGAPPPIHPPITEATPHFCQVHNCRFYENSPGRWSHKIAGSNPSQYCNEDSGKKIFGPDDVRDIQLCEKCRTTWGILSEQNGKMVCENCVE